MIQVWNMNSYSKHVYKLYISCRYVCWCLIVDKLKFSRQSTLGNVAKCETKYFKCCFCGFVFVELIESFFLLTIYQIMNDARSRPENLLFKLLMKENRWNTKRINNSGYHKSFFLHSFPKWMTPCSKKM